MTDLQLLNTLENYLEKGENVALATITKADGSSPGKEGSMMVVTSTGETYGTVGGGAIEKTVTGQAVKCIEAGTGGSFHYGLNTEQGSLGMQCGGDVDVYIRVFQKKPQLWVIGGGHISKSLYQFSEILDFEVEIFEDRQEYASRDRFPKAKKINLGKLEETLPGKETEGETYAVVVTRGHRYDQAAVEYLLEKELRYIGMIGSKNKVKNTLQALREKGVSKERLDRLYAPVGVDLKGPSPEEIALSIMTEMVVIKNKGNLIHLKDE
ncbi:XdhC family protein [Isachenkonia alkalipeptolytica]|uniref:Xanthine dehydrogenase n=1 Tax=Isachenkonia alkalipeptolytica TaxID=2565777 RepID=A0AA43XMP5_9CLOT|nr:XdhC/CoxI family protein [Isachenkonia alkalipeptolytica]NBG89266.1 xanthine dehydrogenase [Isachenkonia alkalipeptolytica]